MIEINKLNLSEFLKHYHFLHDSYISKLDYDVKRSEIELTINVFWSGEPIINKDNSYKNPKIKIRILFKQIYKIGINEDISWDYIDEAYIKYITLNNKEYLCFATETENPLIYIVCNEMHYIEEEV